jgi:hypothetical protein
MKILNLICLVILSLSLSVYLIGRVAIHYLSDDDGDWFLWSGGISLTMLLWLRLRGVKQGTLRGINIAAGAMILFFGCFGTWGILTEAGRREFPEMTGLIPYYAMLFSAAVLILMIIANLIVKRKIK